MLISLSITIFDAWSTPWGNARGQIEVTGEPADASEAPIPAIPACWLHAPTEVEELTHEPNGRPLVMLDVIAHDFDAARQVGAWLERELGLSVEPRWPG